jgi:hypothetical protein
VRTIFGATRVIVLLVLGVCAASSKADNFEGYTSAIKGVGLWTLEEVSNGPTIVRFEKFENGDHSEFVTRCNGRNKIYVYELGSKAFACQSHKWVSNPEFAPKRYTESMNPDPRWQTDLLREPNHKFEGEIAVTIDVLEFKSKSGIYTVSIHKIEQKTWKVFPVTKHEIDPVREIVLLHVHKNAHEGEYVRKTIVGKKLGQALGISLDAVDIMIVPTERIDTGIGYDITSSIISKTDGSYKFLGTISGCIKRIGADIDNDGIPEVITDTCENSEGHSVKYYKIYPTVKLLVDYSHN